MTMFYSRMVETYQEIEATTKRLEITKLLVDLLKETPSEIVDKVVYLTQGKLYPDYLGIEIGIAEKLAIKALPMEAKYVIRTALGRLRLGVADMTLLDALAHALADGKESKPLLEQAYNRSSDLGFVAKSLASGGIDAIRSFKVTVGRP